MSNTDIFSLALSIEEPWFIEEVKFDGEGKRIDVHINFLKGSSFPSQREGYDEKYKVHETVEKKWRHLNFFEHDCYLHCRTPRIDLGSNKTEFISPPWAGNSSGFTLLFEALVITLCQHMTVLAASRIVKESDDKLWRLLRNYVSLAKEEEDYSNITSVGMDETSRSNLDFS